MIICLSEMVRADTLTDSEHRVDEACRRQLRVEVLHRVRNIFNMIHLIRPYP